MSLKVMKYSASWCGPCKVLAPIYKKVAQEYSGKVEFEEIDIDESPEKAVEMSVRAVPTMVFVKDGSVVNTVVGLMSEALLKETIESHLV